MLKLLCFVLINVQNIFFSVKFKSLHEVLEMLPGFPSICQVWPVRESARAVWGAGEG